MLSTLSATEVAFVIVAVMQAVLALVWLIGGWWAGDTRRASVHWAAYSAWGAFSFVMLMLAMRAADAPPSATGFVSPLHAELLRAAGNVTGVFAIIELRRGIWVFLGRAPVAWFHPLVIATVLAVAWIGLDPAHGALRVGVNSMFLTWMTLDLARALYLHGRDAMRLRWPWLLILPVLIASLAYALRGLRAVAEPAAVAAEMTTHSGLNVGAAISYVVLSLAFHATLMTLVVARLVSELFRLSQRDGLTGLLNRRAMEEALDAQWRRSRRSGEAFAVMMVDADHFKLINDRFGHAVGDLALKHVSALLHDHMRDVDRLARFGGEEFLVMLPGVTQTVALAVAERVRQHIATTPLVHAGPPIEISISIGVAQWNGGAEDLSRLLIRADAALYQAKQNGRDRVALAEPASLAFGVA